MRLTLLITSPRVAPGLMSWTAWQAIASADRRLASSADHPVCRAVAAAGHPVEVLPVPSEGGVSGAEVSGAEVSGGALLDAARAADVVWLADDAEAERLPTELATALVNADPPRPDTESGRVGARGHVEPADPPRPDVEVEVLHASYDVPGARLLDLVTVMDELRRSCPWDREQTHESLARYLLEESYETLEAIETGDYAHLREELGDLLLQVYFHARIASEDPDDAFTIDDVAAGIIDKLVHRHPHVFAGVDVADAAEVEVNWESLKATEKGRASVLEGVPMAMPALALADKVLGKAAKVAVAPGAPPSDSLGDRLLALVAEARAAGLDAEQELRSAVRRLAAAVRAAESSRTAP